MILPDLGKGEYPIISRSIALKVWTDTGIKTQKLMVSLL